MKSHAFLGTGVIAVALTIIAIDAADLRGQRNSNVVGNGAPVFPQPNPNDNQVPQQAAGTSSVAGKTAVSQQKALFPTRGARSGKLGYDPSRNAPLSPKTNPGRPTYPVDTVTTANAQTTAGKVSTVTQAGHHAEPNRGINRDGYEVPVRNNLPEPPTLSISPMQRSAAPGVRGAYLGLQGETPLELSIRLKQDVQELERQNEDLRQANMNLQQRYDESQNHLLTVVREIQSARKDLELSRNDLERLRTELQNLQDKIRIAQKEHTELLQSMGPLLQQMLEADDVSSLPPSPME